MYIAGGGVEKLSAPSVDTFGSPESIRVAENFYEEIAIHPTAKGASR
jgi:L-asparaginase/Glu-tRNA(Gln) amidotransferase subunit D